MEARAKNKEQKKTNQLSILVSQDGLSFCFKEGDETEILKRGFDKPLDPGGILEKIRAIIREKNLEAQKPDRVVVVYANNLYSPVPEVFFDENRLSDYLKFNVKILETDFIAFDRLKEQGINNVYVPYANINNYFFDLFGEFGYRHSTTVLMENLLGKTNPGKEVLYAHLEKHNFDLLAVQDGKLQLCNSFFIETPEDFLYYVLFASQQLRWDPEKFDLKVLGNVNENSEEFKLAYTYIRNCGFLENGDTSDYILLNSLK